MTAIAGCCARAASGQAAAVPARSEMNSRRLISDLNGSQRQIQQHKQRYAAELDDIVSEKASRLDLFLHKRTDLVNRFVGPGDPRQFALIIGAGEFGNQRIVDGVGEPFDGASELSLFNVAKQYDPDNVRLVYGAVQIGLVEQQFFAIPPRV